MPLLDASYKHWDGVHCGLWERRLTIARNGLTACLRNKWMRYLVMLCWTAALGMVAVLFFLGQLLVPDSLIVKLMENFNPGLQSFARMLTTWLEQHPEISVRVTQNVLFYYFSTYLLRAGIFALGMAIPLLITRDLASNAIIIYSSKAVSRGDYLLGKFSTAFGVLSLTWLGPVCAAWFVGNLLAPDWHFFWHSRIAIGNALICGFCGSGILSLLALGVSAISPKEKSTVALWYIWWIVGGVVAPIALHTQPWLQHLSFNYNLQQIIIAIFKLGDDLKLLQENVPVFGDMLRNISPQSIAALNTPTILGAALGLLAMLGAAAAIIRRRVRPE